MSRNSRNGESAKNRISEFSPNSPFSSKLPFPRAPLPSHLPWKLYFGEFLPYSSNWPLSSKSLLWTAPLCHIIWLVHITMANFCHFTVFAKFAIFVKIANLKWDPWSFLISLVPKALAKFRPIRHFRHERVFPTFLIAGVWIRLYSYISGLLKTATVLFVCFAKCQPLLKPRASAKSISQKLTHFPGKVLHLALFRNKTWVLWSLQEWPISCGYMSGILFFSQFDSFQTPWIFYPRSWLQSRKFEIKLG